MAHDFLLIIVVSLLFMSMLRECIMILILTQKGGCDCGFVISYCLLLLMTLIPSPGDIPSFPDVKRETERERKKTRKSTVEKFDES